MEDMNRSEASVSKYLSELEEEKLLWRVQSAPGRPRQLVHKKNGWLDEDGKTYIHYSVADIMADTGCGKNKILKCLKELEVDESAEKILEEGEVC